MDLSIIVPVFNIEKYTAQCIESILAQSFSEFECILVDDGSQDHSGKICDTYAEKDTRIKVIHKTNGGLVSARKAGFMIAQGKYIAFVDGDDWIEPGMYKRLINEMESVPSTDLVVCGYYEEFHNRTIEKDGVSKGVLIPSENRKRNTSRLINEEFFFEFIYRPNMWGKLFLKEKLESFLMNEDEQITMGEDVAVTFPYMLSCNQIRYVAEHLYHYRQHQASMVHAYDEKLSSKIKILLKYMKSNPFMKEFAISNEILLYSYYLVVFAFRNEALKGSLRAIYWGVKELHKDEEIMNIVRQVRLPNAKLYHRLFYASLSGGGDFDHGNFSGMAETLYSVDSRVELKSDKYVSKNRYQQGVSVIVPLYYGKKYIDGLYQMITTALDQAKVLAESEIIFVNDSPDEIISLRECEHARLIYNKCNIGIHGSKCNGVKYARGTYIHFLDQDDRISLDFYKSQLENIDDADIIVCNAILENEGYQRILYRSKISLSMVQNPKSYVYIGNRVESLGQCLIRKNAIPPEWMETIMTHNGADDYYLLLSMFVNNRRFKVNAKVLYRHVYTSNNLSLDKAAMIESVKEITDLMQMYYPYSDTTRLLDRRIQYLGGKRSLLLLPFMILDVLRKLSRMIRG